MCSARQEELAHVIQVMLNRQLHFAQCCISETHSIAMQMNPHWKLTNSVSSDEFGGLDSIQIRMNTQ